MHLNSLGFICIHLDSLGLFTCIHLDSLRFIWTHVDSCGSTWIHLDSLGLTWKGLTVDFVVIDAPTAKRVRAQPLSDFVAQVVVDHPGLSVAEAKVAADTLLSCADFVTQQWNAVSSRPT